MFQAPQEVNGNLFFFFQGGAAGINRHDQHIPKVDKLSQIKSCLQEGIWGIMVQWQFIYLWPHFVLAEVIITLPPGGKQTANVCVRVCAFSTCMRQQPSPLALTKSPVGILGI